MVVTCMVLRHRSMQFIGADIFLLGRFFPLDNYPFTKFLGGGGGLEKEEWGRDWRSEQRGE